MKKRSYILLKISILVNYSTTRKYAKCTASEGNIRQSYEYLQTYTKDYFVYGGNTRFYPNPPKMIDLEIISLSKTAIDLRKIDKV